MNLALLPIPFSLPPSRWMSLLFTLFHSWSQSLTTYAITYLLPSLPLSCSVSSPLAFISLSISQYPPSFVIPLHLLSSIHMTLELRNW
jgi:hypothetical protein